MIGGVSVSVYLIVIGYMMVVGYRIVIWIMWVREYRSVIGDMIGIGGMRVSGAMMVIVLWL